MTTIIKLRRDTAANWTSSNPILAAGEPGLETDTLKIKYGDGSNTWANLSYQSVGNATFATSATTANIALSVDVANVSNIGNIATINLDGNVSNLLAGDGTFVAIPAANIGNIATVNLDGNVGNVLSGNGTWIAAGGGNASTGNFIFSNNIVTLTGEDAYIKVYNSTNVLRSQLQLANIDGLTKLSGYSTENTNTFTATDWDTAQWTSTGTGQVEITNSPSIEAYVANTWTGLTANRGFRINGGNIIPYDGFSYGGNNVTLTANVLPPVDPTTVTSLEFIYQNESYVETDFDNTQLTVQGGTLNLNLESDSTVVVNSNDFTVNANDDIRLYANDIFDLRNYSTLESIQIRTDYGNADHIWAFGPDGNLVTPTSLTIGTAPIPGTAIFQAANTALTMAAQDANGFMTIGWAENSNAPSNTATISFNYSPGNMQVLTGNAGATQYAWDFDNTGNLSIPGSIIGVTPNNNGLLTWFGNTSGDGAGYTTLSLVPDSTLTGTDQYLILDPTAPGHIHIRAGGTQDDSLADLFLGGENSYFKVSSGLNQSVYVAADSNVWTFGNNGDLTVPNYINFKDGTFIGDEGGASPPVFRVDAPLGLGINLTTDSNISGNNYTWSFGVDGNLTLPNNTIAINFNNGSAAFGNIVSVNLDSNVSNVLTGNGTFTALPVINANTVVWTTAPTANTDPGTAGQIAYDAGGNLYVCVTTNTWAKFSGTTSW